MALYSYDRRRRLIYFRNNGNPVLGILFFDPFLELVVTYSSNYCVPRIPLTNINSIIYELGSPL